MCMSETNALLFLAGAGKRQICVRDEHTTLVLGDACYQSRDLIHWHRIASPVADMQPLDARICAHGACLDICCCDGVARLSLPYRAENACVSPVPEVERLRIWKREFWYERVSERTVLEGRFAYRNRGWRDIDILPATGQDTDIHAACVDVTLSIDTGREKRIDLCVLGIELGYDVKLEHLRVAGRTLESKRQGRFISVRVLADAHAAMVFCGEAHLFFAQGISADTVVLSCDRGTAVLTEGCICGLRSPLAVPELPMPSGAPLYSTPHYSVYAQHVVDRLYGEPFAYVSDRSTVYSPNRVTETFDWHRSPYGDMQRVNNRSDVWRAGEGIRRFPDIAVGIPTVDAAYRIALTVLDDASNDRFAMPGERGMWSAGGFQGPGFGFGVWRRDTAQIVMRAGNLLDPAVSRRSILYTLTHGFNNGLDGIPTPIMALWDYYLATGDASALHEGWPALKTSLCSALEQFDESRALFHTDRSSSNDAFPEPEAGGYHLSTEIYLLSALEAAVEMAEIVEDHTPEITEFARVAKAMRQGLSTQFFHPEKGYFTSGPRGSVSFERGYWETCGIDAALWSKFGIASKEQRRAVLDALPNVALTDFGIPLMPYHRLKNHFTHAAWIVYSTGIAEAAAAEGRGDLLFALIAQQVRNAVLNKTFYEVMDTDTGLAWRWPDQTWHAAGFLSMLLYGVFGIRYDREGLTIAPFVPRQLYGIRMSGLHYREATVDVVTEGWGRCVELLVNGQPLTHLPADCKGRVFVRARCEHTGKGPCSAESAFSCG